MKYVQTFLAILLLFLTSCSSSKTVVSQSADLSHYQYASIIKVMNYGSSVESVDINSQINEAFKKSRLQPVDEQQIAELTAAEQEKLLLVRVSVTQSDESSLSMNFVDYNSGHSVASCESMYKGSGSSGRNLKTAFNRLAKLVETTFPK
jgi:hypothetical protein